MGPGDLYRYLCIWLVTHETMSHHGDFQERRKEKKMKTEEEIVNGDR